MNWKCLKAKLETRGSHSLGADAFNKDTVGCPKMSKDSCFHACVYTCMCMYGGRHGLVQWRFKVDVWESSLSVLLCFIVSGLISV